MSLIVLEETIRIPEWVTNLEGFRRWARSDDFPERGQFSHLAGELWVDLSMERIAHNKAKGKISSVLTLLVEKAQSGHFLHDRMLLTHVEAELSTEPDAMFVSHHTLQTMRVHVAEGAESIEVEGSPDMVLEVVSPKSVRKDTVVLRELYWKAGVREYWLVDPRSEKLIFDILRHGAKGYTATRKPGGWVKSAVFGKSFRLSRSDDAAGIPEFNLAVR